MKNKSYLKIFFFIIIVLLLVILNFSKKDKNLENITSEVETYNSNIIKDINYISEDTNGNKYIITADEGETDLKYIDIIFLKNVKAIITTKSSEKIIITSDFGKYNIVNNDTIFSTSVVVEYLNNIINGENLEYSSKKNTIIISKNVKYKNLDNILRSDVIEMDIATKNTKIYMYDKMDKVNINNQENNEFN